MQNFNLNLKKLMYRSIWEKRKLHNGEQTSQMNPLLSKRSVFSHLLHYAVLFDVNVLRDE